MIGLLYLMAMIFVPTLVTNQAAANPAMQRSFGDENATVILMIVYGAMGLSAVEPGGMHIFAGWRNYRFRNRNLGTVALGMGLITVGSCYCIPTAVGLLIDGLIVFQDVHVKQAFAAVAGGRAVDSIFEVPAA